jgi:septum formation protein
MLGSKYLSQLLACRVVLASQSPRRQSLLREQLQLIHLEAIPSNVPEDIDKDTCSSPEDYVLRTCQLKSACIRDKLSCGEGAPDIIIAADTIVVADEGKTILEKPSTPAEAKVMMQQLSGREHEVMTAVALLRLDRGSRQYRSVGFVEKTKVTFSALSEDVIDTYCATSEPYDKAGGYGIQGPGGSSFVSGIQGCYYNVMGLPLNRLCTELIKLLNEN